MANDSLSELSNALNWGFILHIMYCIFVLQRSIVLYLFKKFRKCVMHLFGVEVYHPISVPAQLGSLLHGQNQCRLLLLDKKGEKHGKGYRMRTTIAKPCSDGNRRNKKPSRLEPILKIEIYQQINQLPIEELATTLIVRWEIRVQILSRLV